MPQPNQQPSVKITLDEIHDKVQQSSDQIIELTHAVNKMVAINERLDSHKQDIKDLGERHKDMESKRIQPLELEIARMKFVNGIVIAVITAVIVGFAVNLIQ